MPDEILGRMWVEHHQDFSDALHATAVVAGVALQRLARTAATRWAGGRRGATR